MPIGTIRPSGLANPQYLSDAGSSAFRHGVGTALQGLARRLDLEYQQVKQEQEAEQERQQRFDAERLWIKEQGAWARSQQDTYLNAPASGAGLTTSRYDALRARGEAMLEKIPEGPLRDEYRLKYEAQLENFTTRTYAKEFELRLDYETEELKGAFDDMAEGVFTGELNLNQALVDAESLIENSTMSEAGKNDLRSQIRANLLSIDFQREVNGAVGGTTPVRPTDGQDAVAPGISAYQRGFLNGIADAEAAGYNTLVGGGTFESYADHPRKTITIRRDGKEIKSTAAGRYQFLASTWDYVAKALNLRDFSPVNQDRAALWLAEQDYNRRKGANDRTWAQIMVDGTDEEILRAKSILAGSGSATTWEGLQVRWKSDADFLAVFKGMRGVQGGGNGSASVPDVWNDPRYEDLSFDEKMKLSTAAGEAQNELVRQQIAAQEAFFTELKANVATGAAKPQDVLGAIQAGEIAVKDIPAAMKLIEDELDAATAAQEFQQNFTDGIMMTNSADNQAAAMKLLKDGGAFVGLQNLDPVAASTVSEIFGRSGVVPDEVTGLLEQMARSSNPQQQVFALDTLAQMNQRAPELFGSVVSKELRELSGAWTIAKKYSPQGEDGAALQMIQQFLDPTQAAAREATRKIADENLEEFTADDIAGLFDAMSWTADAKAPATPQARAIFQQDFEKLYRHYFPMFGDDERTKEFVTQQMSYNWGTAEPVTGNSTLMYLGPTSSVAGYRPIMGSYDWMRSDILDTFGWSEDQEFSLISDKQTEADIANQEPASYVVWAKDENGLWRTQLAEDGLTPARIRFTINDDLVQEEVLRRALIDTEARANAIRAEMPVFQNQPGPSVADRQQLWKEQNAELAAQMEEARQQAEALRRQLRENRLKRNPNASALKMILD